MRSCTGDCPVIVAVRAIRFVSFRFFSFCFEERVMEFDRDFKLMGFRVCMSGVSQVEHQHSNGGKFLPNAFRGYNFCE